MVTVHPLRDTKQAPLVRWVPVAGSDGRIHLEMRWQVEDRHPVRHAPRSAA